MNIQLTRVDNDSPQRPATHDLFTKLSAVLKEVTASIAPVWPLKDYVAVNPYFGLSDRSFMSARSFLRVFSDCETLMPLEYYAAQWRSGHFDVQDIEQALSEISWPHSLAPTSAAQIVELLDKTKSNESTDLRSSTSAARPQPIRCISDHASSVSKIDWREVVVDEISKFCAAHYDDGQSSWSNAWQELSLFTAWRETAQIDRNAEVLGLKGMRRIAAVLPDEPEAAIIDLLCRLNVPYQLWSTVLLSQIYSMPGWFAWAKYQDEQQADASQSRALTSLLAIRLAFDFAVGRAMGFEVNWKSYLHDGCASFQIEDSVSMRQAWVRLVLLRATEIHYRRQLLNALPSRATTNQGGKKITPTTQMVFCIDVRSERMRRQLESISPEVETFGFAGFFGLPIEYLPLGETQATSQLPVLLKPQYCVHECLHNGSPNEEAELVSRRTELRWWRKLWQSFKSSPLSSFGFVESSGLLAGVQLVRRALRVVDMSHHQLDGVHRRTQSVRPSVSDEHTNSISLDQQIELTAKILCNLGLTKGLAKLVVFCGHFSQTSNNPLAAGLDCGACGGHSGAPNARWLALVLNQTEIRLGLCARGIVVPPQTHFIAAAHNTTTDAITFYDSDELPESHRGDFAAFQQACTQASEATACERLADLNGQRAADVNRRATDWSEVRPEWGLAGNAAFIIGPRAITKRLDLKGQTFLHSYDASQDSDGAILEAIMTAPMIVTNWINMQYYASTVDNNHFGSGSKAVHNVVGKFGILSGNSGDLQTGLPLQSLHDGTEYRHAPLRLLVLIYASRDSISRVYNKHELVANLINNEWLSMVAVEDEGYFKLFPDGQWQLIPLSRDTKKPE